MPTYELCEGETWYAAVEAESVDAALEIARSNVDRAAYDADGDQGTLYIDIRARNTDDADDTARDTVTLDPPAPKCVKGSWGQHAWDAPYAVVGGLRENPGVWGKGGGVLIREVCALCGRYRVRDTWAQHPSTGQQGLESVRYEDADDKSLGWIESL